MQLNHWQHHDHHLISVLMTRHDQKGPAASCFYCLDLRSAMVALMTPLTPHDNDAGTIGIMWQKIHVASQFNHLDLVSGKVAFTMLFASCDVDADPIGDTGTKSYCRSFQSAWPKVCKDSTDNAIGIIWFLCLHLISVVLT